MREQTTQISQFVTKNTKYLEFGDYIRNHREKCIQISTNMPDIGLDICEYLSILRRNIETKDFVW